MNLQSKVKLNSGAEIPVLGLGVFRSKDGEETYNAVRWALDAGYRHIDTAAVYRNEASVGRAIEDSGIPRDQIWITTKLWNDEIRAENEEAAFAASLERLRTDYVDLYLVPTGRSVKTTVTSACGKRWRSSTRCARLFHRCEQLSHPSHRIAAQERQRGSRGGSGGMPSGADASGTCRLLRRQGHRL